MGTGNVSGWHPSPPPPDTVAPTSPTSSTATDTPLDHGASVNLAWLSAADNVGVVGYRLYRGTESGAYDSTRALPAVNSYSDTSCATGTRYYYALSAVDAAGNEGPRSPGASVVPVDDTQHLTPGSTSNRFSGTNDHSLAIRTMARYGRAVTIVHTRRR